MLLTHNSFDGRELAERKIAMQLENGNLCPIEENKIPDELKRMLDTNPNNVPLVKVGDVFKIRDCRFEVTEIREDGISAKGISRGEFLDKTFHIR